MERVVRQLARLTAAALLLASASGCGGEDSQLLAMLRAPEGAAEAQGPAPSPGGPPPGAPDAGPAGIELIEGGGTSSYPEPEEEPAEEPLYGYVDASGSMRMVRGLENVPAEHRQRARNLSAVTALNRIDTPPRPAQGRSASWQPEFNPNRFEAVLYSSESCGYCARTRSLLDSHGVSYELRDIHRDPDAKEEVRRVLGRVSVPLLGVNGAWVSGYKPDAIRRVLGLDG